MFHRLSKNVLTTSDGNERISRLHWEHMVTFLFSRFVFFVFCWGVFTVALTYAIQDREVGVCLRFRFKCKVFDSTYFQAKSKTFHLVIRELHFADDADLVTHI